MKVWATGATLRTITANGHKVWLPQEPRELLRERERKAGAETRAEGEEAMKSP